MKTVQQVDEELAKLKKPLTSLALSARTMRRSSRSRCQCEFFPNSFRLRDERPFHRSRLIGRCGTILSKDCREVDNPLSCMFNLCLRRSDEEKSKVFLALGQIRSKARMGTISGIRHAPDCIQFWAI